MKSVEEFFTSSTLHKTIAEEFQNWDIDSNEIKSIPEFPNIPLIVIARDNKVTENSDHEVYLDQPDVIIHNLKTLMGSPTPHCV